jgi:hypothetical protein
MISTNLTIIANEMKKFSMNRYSSHKARIPDMTLEPQNVLYVVLKFLIVCCRAIDATKVPRFERQNQGDIRKNEMEQSV